MRKGIVTLLKSWKSISHKMEMSSIHLVVCGIASDDYESLNFLKTHSPSFRIEYLPRVTEEQKLYLIRRALAVIVPSNYESFGIVALEALQQGKTVISSRCVGLAELMRGSELMF